MTRLALIAAAGLILAGCGSSHALRSGPKPHSHYPLVGHSPVVTPVRGLRLRHFAQFLSPTRLGIATRGSSSCPSVPDELVVMTSNNIRIHLTAGSWDGGKLVARPPPSGVCTADYGTTQMMLTIDPTQIDVHRPVTVRVVSNHAKKPFVLVVAPLN